MGGSILFVTGTDTGVGKTAVSCLLAAGLRHRGLNVGVFKPAETGCAVGPDGNLIPADAVLLRTYAGGGQLIDDVCPYRLPEPLAPAVAAQRAGVHIDFPSLCERIQSAAKQHDVVLVEGAGGWLVPLTSQLLFADLAVALQAKVLVVVANRLGALNHALLTAQNVRMHGAFLSGIVWNHPAPGADVAQTTNLEVLRTWLGEPLGNVPHWSDGLPPPEVAAAQAGGWLDFDRILPLELS